MAFGDNPQLFTTLDDALARVYDLRKEHPQFHRLGETSRWFNPRRSIPFKGKGYFYDALIQPSSPMRMKTYANARSQAFPIARDLKYQTLSVQEADLKGVLGTVKINRLDEKRAKDQRFAVADLVLKVVDELEADWASQMNAKLHQSGNASIVNVAEIFDADGTTFTGAAGTAAAYIQVDGGVVAAINVGDVLEITDSDGSTLNVTCTVNDIIYGKDGPWSGGTKVTGIGPGFRATPTAAWNNVAVPADGDFIARSGEFDEDEGDFTNFHGLPDWRDSTVDVYRNEAGALLDREATGNAWQMPEVFVAAAAGSEVVFDIDEHFRDPEDVLPARIKVGRVKREKTLSGMEDGPSISKAMLAVMSPALVNQTVRDAVTTQRFQATTSMSLDAAQRRELFGNVGFEGTVYHSATLGVVAMQADPAARPNEVQVLEPNSFFWVEFDGNASRIEWLEENGTRWRIIDDADETGNRTPTMFKQAAAFSFVSLQNDQIASNFWITGVKSDNA